MTTLRPDIKLVFQLFQAVKVGWHSTVWGSEVNQLLPGEGTDDTKAIQLRALVTKSDFL